MNYEIVVMPSPDSRLSDVDVVIVHREDGSTESFPVDETNPRYVQFLKETA